MLNSLTLEEIEQAHAAPPLRTVPHNLDLEQALLGAILINNATLERVTSIIGVGHFFDPLHQEIFGAILDLTAKGRRADPLTLKAMFDGAPSVGDLTVPQYLGTLAGKATTTINALDYAGAIVDLATRRSLIVIGEDVVNSAYDAGAFVAPQALIEDAEARLFEIAEKGRNVRDEISFADASMAAVKATNEARMSGGKMRGLSTGFASLDNKLGGLQKSDLIILAGRPSMGKTALATNIAWNIARDGLTVDFRSLEMSAEQLATRILSSVAGVPSEKLRRGSLDEKEMRAVIEAQQAVKDTPLLTDESGGLSIAQLAARARRTKRKHGTELIVIDYLQLMAGGKRSRENRVQEITEITTGLKALAKELQVPIIALSQLNRGVEGRTEKRPQLADLRESGSIEQDADVVLFVYREEYYVERTQPDPGDHAKHAEWQAAMLRASGKAEVIIGKQRHGPTGIVPMAFNGSLTRFDDLARDYIVPPGGGHG
jgi:replicative DNA helicase